MADKMFQLIHNILPLRGRLASIGVVAEGCCSHSLWNDSRTRAAREGWTKGKKHATFTANFRAHGAISGVFFYKIKRSSLYMLLYFLLKRFV
jgi:hypothetical protein